MAYVESDSWNWEIKDGIFLLKFITFCKCSYVNAKILALFVICKKYMNFIGRLNERIAYNSAKVLKILVW